MNKKTHTPIYIGIIILVIILAGFSFYMKSIEDPYIATTPIESSPNDDQDNDGLKNWEETLWKTDPNNPDTDGDGTNDGNEINQGRDPVVKGPDDNIEGILFNGSNTDDLAVSLLSSYVETVNQDGSINDNAQDIANRALEADISKPFVITYDSSNLNYGGNTIEDYRVYGNNFAQLFSYFQNSPDEIRAVTRAMQSNDPNELLVLDTVIGNYQSFLSNFLTMSVPSEIGDEHLIAANSLSEIIADINGMKLLFTDTIIAVDSISTYQITAKKVQTSLADIINKIIESGVQYSPGEIGYGLVNVL
jgi:hypothetical protein